MHKNKTLRILLLSLFFCFVCVSLTYCDKNNDSECSYKDAFVLPTSLEMIEAEAFAETAVRYAIFPNGIQKIESDAFLGAVSLKDVFLPDSVSVIASSAFSQNTGLTIHGIEGSYVQKWAAENGFDFIADDIWTDTRLPDGIHFENILSLFWIICPVYEKSNFRFVEIIRRFVKSMRPQDRPELYPINYRFP